MNLKITILFFYCSMIVLSCSAQFPIPTFDVAVKPGYFFIDGNTSSSDQNMKYESLLGQAELNIHVNHHIALGYFYQRNAFISNYHGKNNGTADQPGSHLMHGFNLRLSAGRSVRWRPYINIKYFALQTVIHYPGFNLAYDGTGIGGGAGLMLRLSHRLYFNVIEAEIYQLQKPGEVIFVANKLFPQVKTGVTYNFLKRK
jgi:hypothetical protein